MLNIELISSQHLVVFESQKIKEYVFTSTSIRETRGASLLLDRLVRVEAKEIFDQLKDPVSHIIFLGGGNGRLLFSSKEFAEEFCELFKKKAILLTPGAKLAVEVVPPEDAATVSDRIRLGIQKCSIEKLSKATTIADIAGRWLRYCSSCGRGAAEEIFEEFGRHYLCKACHAKRAEVNTHYNEVKPGVIDQRKLKAPAELATRYGDESVYVRLAKQFDSGRKTISLPQSFQDIGSQSSPAGYMAFLFADGNSMGEVVKQIGNEEDQQKKLKPCHCFLIYH